MARVNVIELQWWITKSRYYLSVIHWTPKMWNVQKLPCHAS